MDLLYSFVASHNIAISAGILILAYIFIATEKIPKVTIALLGAGLTIFLGLVSSAKSAGDLLNPQNYRNFE